MAGSRIRKSAFSSLRGKTWDVPHVGLVTVVGAYADTLHLIDDLWPQNRRPTDAHAQWKWSAISQRCEDCYVLLDSDEEPLAIWASKRKSPIMLEGRSYYRLDFIEVRPDLRQIGGETATFALGAVATRALEIGAQGVVLAAFPIEGVVAAYVTRGAEAGVPKGWSYEGDLVPLTFPHHALNTLKGAIDELEIEKP